MKYLWLISEGSVSKEQPDWKNEARAKLWAWFQITSPSDS